MAVTFNGIERFIEVTDNTVFNLDVERDLYSEWKRWSQIGDNSKYAPAFRTFGGDGTAIGQTAPKYFFLQNFWRVRINNGNVVAIALNLYTDDYATPYVIIPGSGVSDRNSDAVSVNSEDIEFASYQNRVTIDQTTSNTGIVFPVGTPRAPVNNITDAITLANLKGFTEIYFKGELDVTNENISGFKMIGDNPLNAICDLQGTCITERTNFQDCTLTGSVNGAIYAKDCALDVIENVGTSTFPTLFENCLFREDGATAAVQFKLNGLNQQNIHFINCRSGVPGSGTSTIDVNGSDAPFAFRDYSGGIAIDNYTAGQISTIEIDQGQAKFLSGCTLGTVEFRGGAYLTQDDSGPNFTINQGANWLSQIYEIINAGGSLTPDQNQRLIDLHKSRGLDIDHEVTHTDTGFTVDDITVEILGSDTVKIAQRI